MQQQHCASSLSAQPRRALGTKESCLCATGLSLQSKPALKSPVHPAAACWLPAGGEPSGAAAKSCTDLARGELLGTCRARADLREGLVVRPGLLPFNFP